MESKDESTLSQIFDTARDGFVGNRADAIAVHVVWAIAKNIFKRVRKDIDQKLNGDRPVKSQDLKIAVARSLLKAQNVLVFDCLSEVTGGTWHGYSLNGSYVLLPGRESDFKWLQEKRDALEADIHSLGKKRPGNVLDQPLEPSELLRFSQATSSEAINSLFRDKLSETILEDQAPVIYRERFRAIGSGCLEIMSQFLLFELKESPHTYELFELQLLSQNNELLRTLSIQPIRFDEVRLSLESITRELPEKIVELANLMQSINKDVQAGNALTLKNNEGINELLKLGHNHARSLERLEQREQLLSWPTSISTEVGCNRTELLLTCGVEASFEFLYRSYVPPPREKPNFIRSILREKPLLISETLCTKQVVWCMEDGTAAFEMVFIPSGNFLMGESDRIGCDIDTPTRSVSISSSFYMGKYPVTQTQWKIIAEAYEGQLNPDPSFYKGEHNPVERVTWHEAEKYCALLSRSTGRNFRLPSEAEWEYACRANTTGFSPYGCDHDSTQVISKEDGLKSGREYEGESHSIYVHNRQNEGFTPNQFGLYHMLGNVQEWCLDHWHNSYRNAPTDGRPWIDRGDDKKRIIRGGSHVLRKSVIRSARREGMDVSRFVRHVGFRVIMEVLES
jgi:formylglycine-generating enzyme required for sulfatase activity